MLMHTCVCVGVCVSLRVSGLHVVLLCCVLHWFSGVLYWFSGGGVFIVGDSYACT